MKNTESMAKYLVRDQKYQFYKTDYFLLGTFHILNSIQLLMILGFQLSYVTFYFTLIFYFAYASEWLFNNLINKYLKTNIYKTSL